MSEMVERVARAMAENGGFCWENCAQSVWISDARAAIEAMREPTKEMIMAFSSPNDAELYWRGMIIAALA